MAHTIFHAAASRGHAAHGWLTTSHSFSFAGYQDAERVHFGALRVLNDDTIAAGTGFGTHPHDNMEIITIMLDGVLEHGDSTGRREQLQVGEVQVMSAGAGLTHSEKNGSPKAPASLLQIWIFPDKRNIQPRYEQKTFDAAARHNKLQTLVAPVGSNGEALEIQQQAWITRTQMDADQALSYPLHQAGNGVYCFIIGGSITIAGKALHARDALGITDATEIALNATGTCDVLLLEVPMSF